MAPDTVRQNIVQGEFFVSENPEAMISTILGSCVAACIRDPVAGVGGMNHFLLPGEERGRDGARFGAYLMELLINGVLARGGRRERLQAKLFGGANMVSGLTDIGAQNAEFAERFLVHEGIQNVGGSLRGDHGRRIHYWPVSGRASQQILRGDTRPFTAPPKARAREDHGDFELFGAA